MAAPSTTLLPLLGEAACVTLPSSTKQVADTLLQLHTTPAANNLQTVLPFSEIKKSEITWAFLQDAIREIDMPHTQAYADISLMTSTRCLTFLLAAGWSVTDILASIQIILQGIQDMPAVTRRLLLQAEVAELAGSVPYLDRKHLSPGERLQLMEALYISEAVKCSST